MASPADAPSANGTPPTVSVADASGVEGTAFDGLVSPPNHRAYAIGGHVQFPISLSAPSLDTVTVNYAAGTGGGPYGAFAGLLSGDMCGEDIPLPQAGVVTLTPGQTTATVPIAVCGDDAPELNESFTLSLTSPANAVLGRSTAIGTILDDDGPLQGLWISDVAFDEGTTTPSGPQTYQNGGLGGSSGSPGGTVDWATRDASAKGGAACDSGVDYISTHGTANVQANARFYIQVQVCQDSVNEPDESFEIVLSNPTPAPMWISKSVSTVKIVDDDPLFGFRAGSYRVSEGQSAQVDVVRSSNTHLEVSVDVTRVGGSATPGADFVPATTQRITFARFVSVITVPYTLLWDGHYEGDETVVLGLSNPSSGGIGSPGLTTITIGDIDPPPSCTPRPDVKVQTTVLGPGRMQVDIRATTSPSTSANALYGIVFDRLDNARVEMAGQTPTSQPFTVTLASHPATTSFVVTRVAPGPVTVHLRVQDACGEWPTFVGAGVAGF
jgi:hypothetical protein